MRDRSSLRAPFAVAAVLLAAATVSAACGEARDYEESTTSIASQVPPVPFSGNDAAAGEDATTDSDTHVRVFTAGMELFAVPPHLHPANWDWRCRGLEAVIGHVDSGVMFERRYDTLDTSRLIAELRRNAAEMGATAVLDVKISLVGGSGDSVRFAGGVAYGTAVKAAPYWQPESCFPNTL